MNRPVLARRRCAEVLLAPTADFCSFYCMAPPASSAPAESWLELAEGRTVWLTGRCSIGRETDNDLVLEAPELSRHHALIATDGGGYVLNDLHSRNGTYLNRVAVVRPAPLRDGDEILLGTVVLRFRRKRRWFGGSDSSPESPTTVALDQIHERICWLLLVDVVASTALSAKIGSEAALRQMRAWITGLRPLIEKNGGQINGYVGDAVLAYWHADTAPANQVAAALRAIEAWRPQSALPFRLVAHHGPVLFSRSELGNEITGGPVNVLYRSEKIAKGFGARAMISQSVVDTLGLDGKCESFGRSSIDGMSEYFVFYALPEEWSAPA
jgi:class 3 adenylate cyclase